MKLRRLASFTAASAIIIGLLGQSASMVLAVGANTQHWQGQGIDNGQFQVDCKDPGGPGMLWVWTGDGTNVEINVAGEVKPGVPNGQGSFHFWTSFHAPATLIPGDAGNVFVTYDGDVDGNAQLTMSHACEGTTTTTSSSSSSTTTSSSSSSTTTTTETSSSSSSTTTTTSSSTTTTTTTEPTTTTTSFSQTVSGTTDTPTEPNTATIEIGSPSSPASSVWMLIVALGLLLGSVVILTPAPSKSKR